MFARRALVLLLLLVALAPAARADDAREARARALVEEARTRYAGGDFGQRRIAIRLLEEAARLEPKDPGTLEALGRAYLDAGFNHLARVAYEKAVRADSGNAEAQLGLALLYKRNWLRSLADTDLDRAAAYAGAAVRASPGHCEASVLLSVLRVERGDFRGAGEVISRAFAAGCDSAGVYLAGAYLGFRSGNGAQAESLLALARARLPRDVSARFDDVTFMLGTDQAEAFRAMLPADRTAFAGRLWARSDPDPTTDLNEARLEYHARVAHALLVFADRWNPRWDLRAAMMVRFGTPGRVTYLPVGVEDSRPLGTAKATWTSADRMMQREISEPVSVPMNVQVWEYPALGMTVTLHDLVLSQSYEMPRSAAEEIEATPDPKVAEANGIVLAPGGLATFSPLLPGVRRLELAERVSRFDAAGGPLLLAQLEAPGSPADSLFADGVVRDSAGAVVARGSVRLAPSRCDPAERRTAEFSFALPPGSYELWFAVRDGRGGRGVAHARDRVEPAPADLALSDLVPLCGPYEGAAGGAAVRLAPNVGARVPEGAPLHAYFEVYGLRAGEDGRSHFDYVYEVHALGRDARPWYERLLPGRPHARLAVHTEESGVGSLRRQFIQVPVATLPAGEYRLDLAVHDLVAGGRATRSLVFTR